MYKEHAHIYMHTIYMVKVIALIDAMSSSELQMYCIVKGLQIYSHHLHVLHFHCACRNETYCYINNVYDVCMICLCSHIVQPHFCVFIIRIIPRVQSCDFSCTNDVARFVQKVLVTFRRLCVSVHIGYDDNVIVVVIVCMMV